MLTRRTVMAAGAASVAATFVYGCSSDRGEAAVSDALVEFDPSFFDIVSPDAVIEELGQGYQWSEGPAWDAQRSALYFTDVPGNVAYVWTEQDGVQEFLNPSSGLPPTEGLREQGANGLLLAKNGELLISNHGARALEAMDIDSGERRVLAANFEGQRFNSPNDVIEHSNGTLFFTDPPYGLEGQDESLLKEMEANGVYALSPNGALTRVADDMTRPNGVALSPDERFLYVTQSDPDAPIIRRFDLTKMGEGQMKGDLWFDAKPFMNGYPGLPDGMTVAMTGHVLVAGPGGVLAVDPAGTCIGRILTGSATANCVFGGADGKTLFMTAQDRLLRIDTLVRGVGRF